MVESKRKQYIRALKIAANHADDGMITVSVDEAREIIDLLTVQEPRVLTLGDVRRDHDRVLWIECDDSKTQSIGQYRGQVCWHDRHIGKWERFATIGFANDYLHRETEKYGKTWRCWTSCPTPEQMRETPWKEESK